MLTATTRSEQVKGLKTRGVHGTLSTEAAAKKLVEGTGLEVNTDSPRTYGLTLDYRF
jgi:hypothetical protein